MSFISLFGNETSKYDIELLKVLQLVRQLSKTYGLLHKRTKYLSVLEQFGAIDR